MKIFISYRRDDSAGHAGRLFDYLSAHFGADNIFMDIDTIDPGEDFRKAISRAVGTCDVVLVLIGKQWLGMTDAQGQRRLDDPRDWVRMEVAAALANRRTRVIPVLVREASMPDVQELPEGLKELVWRNAMELSDKRFQYDVNKLIQVIERIPGIPERSARMQTGEPRKNAATRTWLITLGVGGLCVLIAVIGYGLSMIWSPKGQAPIMTPTSRDLLTSLPPEVTPTLLITSTENIPTLTPTSAPTFTPTVIPPAPDAVNFYYSQVSADNFELTWNLLSDSYKATVNATGYEPYRVYWSSVDRVTVEGTRTVYDDGRTAVIIVDLTYYYHDGRVIQANSREIDLIYDTQRQTWLINATP